MTIDFHTVLGPACTWIIAESSSKKRLLELAAERIATNYDTVKARTLFDHLMARERLGSTALGDGVAIPHCRLEGQATPIGALIKLDKGLDFDAPDGEPVSLVFVLVAPEEGHDAHLKVLARLAAVLGKSESREALRDCTTDTALYSRIHSLLETAT